MYRPGLPSQLRDDVLAFAESNGKSCARKHDSDVTRDYKMQEFLQDNTSSNQDASSDKVLKMIRAISHQRTNSEVSSAPSSSTRVSNSNELNR